MSSLSAEDQAKVGLQSERNCMFHTSTRLVWRPNATGDKLNQKCPESNCAFKVGAPRGPAFSKQGDAAISDGEIVSGSITVTPNVSHKTATVAAQNGNALGEALYGPLAPYIRADIEREVAARVSEAVAQIGKVSTVIEWKSGDQVVAKVEGQVHRLLVKLVGRIKARRRNLWIAGPAGSGKTQLAHDLARSLRTPDDQPLPFAMISCTAGMPEWHLIGRSTPNLTTGESVYQISEFVRIYRDGGVFLIDEVDAADANTLIILNAALANGGFHVAGYGHVKRHAQCYVIAAANTWGHGASTEYVGRSKLDAAFTNRFAGARFFVDYDKDLEATLAAPAVAARIWELRSKCRDLGLKRIISTRDLIAAHDLVDAGGMTVDAALSEICADWKPEELTRVGVAPVEA